MPNPTFNEAMRTASFGSQDAGNLGDFGFGGNVIYLNYSRTDKGERPSYAAQEQEANAAKHILETLGLLIGSKQSGGDMTTDYGLSYEAADGHALSEAEKKAIIARIKNMSDKEITELAKEGMNQAAFQSAEKNAVYYGFREDMAASYNKQAMVAAVVLTTVDLPKRDGAGLVTQAEVNTLEELAKKHGSSLKLSNVVGPGDSMTVTNADGTRFSQNVNFASNNVKIAESKGR